MAASGVVRAEMEKAVQAIGADIKSLKSTTQAGYSSSSAKTGSNQAFTSGSTGAISNISQTIVSQSTADVFLVTYSMDMENNASATTAAGFTPTLDGAVNDFGQGNFIATLTTASGRTQPSKTYRVTGLSVGSHTLGVNVNFSSGPFTIYATNSTLVIEQVATGLQATVSGPVANLPDYTTTQPASPSSGLTMFARNRARATPAVVDSLGHDTQLQAHIGVNRFMYWIPVLTTATIQGVGLAMNQISNGGTAATSLSAGVGTLVAPTVGTALSEATRVRITPTTTAGTSGDLRGSSVAHFLATTRGGFDVRMRFGFTSVPSTGSRCFVGMHATANQILASADPTALLNMIGVGWNVADTPALFLMTNDGSGTATKTSISGHTSLVANELYELTLYSPPGGGTAVRWALRSVGANVLTQGTLTADLPALGTMMTPHFAIGNGALASQQFLDFVSMTIETDN